MSLIVSIHLSVIIERTNRFDCFDCFDFASARQSLPESATFLCLYLDSPYCLVLLVTLVRRTLLVNSYYTEDFEWLTHWQSSSLYYHITTILGGITSAVIITIDYLPWSQSAKHTKKRETVAKLGLTHFTWGTESLFALQSVLPKTDLQLIEKSPFILKKSAFEESWAVCSASVVLARFVEENKDDDDL